MKKTTLFLATLILASAAHSKDIRDKRSIKYPIQRFSAEVGGIIGAPISVANSWGKAGNYPQAAVYYPGDLKSSGWEMKGAYNAQFSYFPGLRRHFGVGLGILYCMTSGNFTLDSFRVEYKETDGRGYVFRQLATTRQLKESVKLNTIGIPLVAKYKTNISKHVALSLDAGILLSLGASAKYTADATTDFEAIYKFGPNGTTVYDDAPTPSGADWWITKSQYSLSHSTVTYFDSLRQAGYNVALDVHPGKKNGSVRYKAGAIGFLVHPQVAYNVSQNLSVTLGGFYIVQEIKNSPGSDYRLMEFNGNYSSVMNTVTSIKQSSYGMDLGIRYSFGW